MAAVVSIDYVLNTLMELPAGALPNEGSADAIRDLLIKSTCREVEAVGEEACRAAAALIEAVVKRMANDATAAAELAGALGQRPC